MSAADAPTSSRVRIAVFHRVRAKKARYQWRGTRAGDEPHPQPPPPGGEGASDSASFSPSPPGGGGWGVGSLRHKNPNAHSGTNNSTSEIGPFVRKPRPDATAAASHHPRFSAPVRTASNPHSTDTVTHSVSKPSSSSRRATLTNPGATDSSS